MKSHDQIQAILGAGESLQVEFKEAASHLDREIVAFANAEGGSIWLGVRDDAGIVGIDISNRLRSQIIDIARNCDPSITVELLEHAALNLLEIVVLPGSNKPYRCRDGFYLRVGASSQKLRRDEIVRFINDAGIQRFDDSINPRFSYPEDFSEEAFERYVKLCGIKKSVDTKDLLISLNVATEKNDALQFNNAGVLFFAKNRRQFFPEAYLTCVKYNSFDRFSIVDKKEYYGSPIDQIESALTFLLNYIPVKAEITGKVGATLGQRTDVYDYPMVALREAMTNAVTHRDYWYDGSHVYVHMYPDRIDIESPGGLFHGLSLENVENRSVRRNPLIADLLHRAGYIERVGSGFVRIRHALKENDNPAFDLAASNFFSIRFYKRVAQAEELSLTERQQDLLRLLKQERELTMRQAAMALDVSEDTMRRDMQVLLDAGFAKKAGVGRATVYCSSSRRS